MKAHFALTVLVSVVLWVALVVGLQACRHTAPNGTHTCVYSPVDGGAVEIDCNH